MHTPHCPSILLQLQLAPSKPDVLIDGPVLESPGIQGRSPWLHSSAGGNLDSPTPIALRNVPLTSLTSCDLREPVIE